MNSQREAITLTRDVEAITIPDGAKTTLPKGTYATITQFLGDTYTVQNELGQLFRIEGRDADALGKEKILPPTPTDLSSPSVEQAVRSVLKTCYDPEIPVNIVDLGLIYECQVTPLSQDQYKVLIRMTLTAPGCGMGPILKNDVEARVSALPGVKETQVELTFEPAWDPSRMSEAAKLQLGMM